MQEVKYIFYGMIMGMANVVPGVSGGTMAVILNFYDRFVSILSLKKEVIQKNIKFLIFLVNSMEFLLLPGQYTFLFRTKGKLSSTGVAYDMLLRVNGNHLHAVSKTVRYS